MVMIMLIIIIIIIIIIVIIITTSRAEWSGCPTGNQEVAGSISGTSTILKVN